MSRLSGLYIPIVTPFANGEIDTESLRRHIRQTIKQGVDGLVPCGTTGESPTLNRDERLEVIAVTVEEARGRVPVFAGVGGPETNAVIAEVKAIAELNVDGLMVVCPYYNRPSQAGLIQHFTSVASATTLPIIMYNIPQRTAVNLMADSIIKLSQVDNIVGLKEASPSLDQLEAVIAGTTDDFAVFTGEDTLIFASLCLGADGAISAAGNVLAAEYVRMIHMFRRGDIETARQIHYQMRPIVSALFSEPNPGPMKTALHLMNVCGPDVRLPLMPASETCRLALEQELHKLGKVGLGVSR